MIDQLQKIGFVQILIMHAILKNTLTILNAYQTKLWNLRRKIVIISLLKENLTLRKMMYSLPIQRFTSWKVYAPSKRFNWIYENRGYYRQQLISIPMYLYCQQKNGAEQLLVCLKSTVPIESLITAFSISTAAYSSNNFF